MPQGRILLKAICQSKKLADLKTDGARLLYTWLIPNVDINGCFSGDPAVIKGQVFTRLKRSVKVVAEYLEDLAMVGLIVLYESNCSLNSSGDMFLQIPDFIEKQPSLRADRESPSNIPVPFSQREYSKKANIPIALVRQVSDRDGKICQICGKVGTEDAHFKHYVVEINEFGKKVAFEIDHIIPEYLGGETVLANLRLVCRKCNRQKGIQTTPAELRKTPAELRVTPAEVKLSKVKSKESKENYSPNSDEFTLSDFLLKLILARKPDYKHPNLQSWAQHIDRMLRLDNRKPDRIREIVQWCQADDFWQNNILSTEKLRKQFDKLELREQSERKTTTNSQREGAPAAEGRRDQTSRRDTSGGSAIGSSIKA